MAGTTTIHGMIRGGIIGLHGITTLLIIIVIDIGIIEDGTGGGIVSATTPLMTLGVMVTIMVIMMVITVMDTEVAIMIPM